MEILKKTAVLRVQKQTEGKQDDDVTSISLSGVPALSELWTRYTHLTHLLLVCMKPKLGSLASIGLQHLPALRLLDVSDNEVSVPSAVPNVPSLARLLLPNNRVTHMAEVSHIAASFPNLEVLDLVDNTVDTPAHFTAVFAMFPKLVALNARTRDGKEVVVEDSDESESDDDEDEDEVDEDDEDDDGDEEETDQEKSEEEESVSTSNRGATSEDDEDSDGTPSKKRLRLDNTGA